MIVFVLFHSHSMSLEAFLGSLLHTNTSPTAASHNICSSREYNSFEKLFHDSYSLCTFFLTVHLLQFASTYVHVSHKSRLCSINASYVVVLKYFCRMPTLRKIFNQKISPTKILCNKNFLIYNIGQHITTQNAKQRIHVIQIIQRPEEGLDLESDCILVSVMVHLPQ